jgi:hypothetical protein
MAVTACAGTEGDVLRSLPDASSADTWSGDTSIRDSTISDAAPPRPKPEPLMTWQIQLSGTLDTAVDARVYIFDFETSTSTIRSLHGTGKIVICYFSAGTRESFRDDAARFPPESLGAPLASYPNERWVDVRNATVRSIMQDRLVQAAKSDCDGVHLSGLAAYLSTTGLDFTRADQIAYNRWLTTAAHTVGLSIGLADGDAALSQDLVADFDWTVVYGCLATNCAPAAPFVSARKAAFLVEYGDQNRTAEVCPKAKDLGLSAIIKRNADLDAFRVGCP